MEVSSNSTNSTPTLYKLDSKGKVRCWRAFLRVQDNGDVQLCNESGLEGGKISPGIPILMKPKNVGKKNETSGLAQGRKEMLSKLTKKLREGYVEDLNEFKQTGVMKALEFKVAHHRLPSIIMVQPKLDGIRLKITKTENGIVLMSKNNREFRKGLYDLPWALYFDRVLKVGEEVDGEMYIHGYTLPDIQSAVSKENDLSRQLQFWLFDIPIDDEVPFLERNIMMSERYADLEDHGIVAVIAEEANKVDIEGINDHFVEQGFEGTMARNPAGFYAFGHRSPDLQKYKNFFDKEWRIVDWEADRQGNLQPVFESSLGFEFSCRPVGTQEFRDSLQEHYESLIGSLATIRYQGLYPDTQIPQFGRVVAIRNYE